MKKGIKLYLIFGILILLTISLIIATWVTMKNSNNIETVIVDQEINFPNENLVLKNYEEYQAFLTKYNILGKMTNKNFEEYDYIVDIIPYENDMQIISININISNNFKIIYETSPKVKEESQKRLINFIPISKNTISNLKEIDHEFK